MFNYFNRKRMMVVIIEMLKIRDQSNLYPTLVFKYILDNDVLTLILPSKYKYLFSHFPEDITLVYNQKTEELLISPDDYHVMGSRDEKRLVRHVKKCLKKIEERDRFIAKITEERKRMSKYIEKTNRNDSSRKRNKDGSVYRDIVYSAADDSSSDDRGNDSHSNHHDNS